MSIEQLADILERNRAPKDMYDLGADCRARHTV